MLFTKEEINAVRTCPAMAYACFYEGLYETYDVAKDYHYDNMFSAFGNLYPYGEVYTDESPAEYHLHQLGAEGACADAFFRAENNVLDYFAAML